MKDEIAILWGLYQEHITYARHQESQRSTVGMLIITVSSALIGIATYDDKILISDLPIAMLIVVLGLFGAIFSAKHYERFTFHNERTEEYRRKLEEILPSIGVTNLNEIADKRSLERFPRITALRLYKFWLTLHLFVAALGAFLILCTVIP
jgi:hypothetical protein